jgi:hypothetical protein
MELMSTAPGNALLVLPKAFAGFNGTVAYTFCWTLFGESAPTWTLISSRLFFRACQVIFKKHESLVTENTADAVTKSSLKSLVSETLLSPNQCRLRHADIVSAVPETPLISYQRCLRHTDIESAVQIRQRWFKPWIVEAYNLDTLKGDIIFCSKFIYY